MSHHYWPPNGNLSQYILGHFPPGYQGFGVDVGASDGISINTTFALEASHRWTILSVEANPDFGPLLKANRARVEMCACSSQPGIAEFHINTDNPEAYSALRPTTRRDLDQIVDVRWKKVEVRVDTVDALLAKWEFPQLDLLTIDTEGTELDVLKGCDLERWKPKVIVTECWYKVGPIDLWLETFGYEKKARNVHNDIFILKGSE